MIAKTFRCGVAVVALVSSAFVAADAKAQCCGMATTAFYQPAAYTAYSPVVAPMYRTGWYPGYFLDRIRARLWGAPATYVAAYPSTYVASYPSTYVASYPSSYVASYPSSYVASYPTYAASYSTSYAPAGSYTASYGTCGTCCPTTVSYGVTQTSYEQPSACACAPASGSTTIVVPNGTVVPPGTQQGTTYNGGQPQLPQEFEGTPRRTERQTGEESEPDRAEGVESPAEGAESDTTTETGASFEAPALLNPNDRTARRSIAPVRTAVYEQPARHRRLSATPIKVTAQQAERDAIGWRSASN